MHNTTDLINIFHHCFLKSHETLLVKGGDEPIYLPKDNFFPYHRIVFANGYFSSALHECSHWLIAGETRRMQVDYGYWYAPDGRTPEQQKAFESIEAKPQALEWILSKACNYPFRMSFDNLNGAPCDIETFKQNIYLELEKYLSTNFSSRVQIFIDALQIFYHKNIHKLTLEQFQLLSLQ